MRRPGYRPGTAVPRRVPDGVPCGRCGPAVLVGVTFGYMNWWVIMLSQTLVPGTVPV
jgi:hypothetical protein